jgi:hypothetical protein
MAAQDDALNRIMEVVLNRYGPELGSRHQNEFEGEGKMQIP